MVDASDAAVQEAQGELEAAQASVKSADDEIVAAQGLAPCKVGADWSTSGYGPCTACTPVANCTKLGNLVAAQCTATADVICEIPVSGAIATHVTMWASASATADVVRPT